MGGLPCEAQHARWAVDDSHDATFARQQDRAAMTTFTTFCERAWPLASRPARLASARAKSGGWTPFFWAQASRSASVWQQQDRQHCSAESHPQPQPEQGNNSPLFDGRLTEGSGMPAATTT
jgi:hypothetical protein